MLSWIEVLVPYPEGRKIHCRGKLVEWTLPKEECKMGPGVDLSTLKHKPDNLILSRTSSLHHFEDAADDGTLVLLFTPLSNCS